MQNQPHVLPIEVEDTFNAANNNNSSSTDNNSSSSTTTDISNNTQSFATHTLSHTIDKHAYIFMLETAINLTVHAHFCFILELHLFIINIYKCKQT